VLELDLHLARQAQATALFARDAQGGAMRASAPAEAFQGVCQLAAQVLDGAAWCALDERLRSAA
jgi:hypothetical protein